MMRSTFFTLWHAFCIYRDVINQNNTHMKTIKKKMYAVNWYCNGFCYRTTTGCDWEVVKHLRKAAKAIGETITYEVIGTKVYNY